MLNRSCPHVAKPHLAKLFVQFCVFNSLAKFLLLLLLLSLFLCCLFLVVVWCCLVLLVGACWCLLVPVGACWCVGACWWCLLVVLVGGCCLCVCVVDVFWSSPPDPPPEGPSLDRPLDRPPKIFALFFSLPPEISFFLLSLGVFSLNFGGVFEDRDAQMCTLGLEPRRPHQTGPPGLHTTTRELQTRTFERPGASNTTKISRENPQREKPKKS